MGCDTARDGLRWHLIETAPGQYDWSSFLPMLRAARDAEVQVVWDLCHYGYPDHLRHLGRRVRRELRALRGGSGSGRSAAETDQVPFYCPVNEISYWAWAGGTVARINPVSPPPRRQS